MHHHQSIVSVLICTMTIAADAMRELCFQLRLSAMLSQTMKDLCHAGLGFQNGGQNISFMFSANYCRQWVILFAERGIAFSLKAGNYLR